MSRIQLLALLCGVCLVAQPFMGVRFAMAEEDEYDEGDAEEAKPAGMDEKDVVVVTSANFDSLIKQHKFALVEFYAPWCGHCKSLAPEYAKAATKLKEIDSSILLGKVDATVESELAEKFGVSGYPTLKWFIDGEPTEYGGGRDEASILQWIQKKTGPPAVTLASKADLKKQEANEVLVVAYFKELSGDAHAAFTSVASASESIIFAETTDAAVAKAAGLSSPGVAVIKNFKGEGREVVVADDLSKEGLQKVVSENKLPLTLEFNQANSEKIFGAGIPRHILMLAKEKDLKSDSASMKVLKEVSAAFKGKFVFVTVNAESDDSDPVVKFFDLDKEVSPSLVGFVMEPKQAKFKYNQELTTALLTNFCESLLDGTLKPEYKSEEVKENDKDGEVQVVVGKSFDALVKDPKKDVLLEVYAPWCGHCKTLAPIYKKLAKRFKDVDSVVIAKLDGTANEHPELEVQGFPTLVFFPAEEGAAPVPYEGERTLKDMTKFIKEHAKISYELKKKSESKDDDDEAEAEEPEAEAEEEDDEKDEL